MGELSDCPRLLPQLPAATTWQVWLHVTAASPFATCFPQLPDVPPPGTLAFAFALPHCADTAAFKGPRVALVSTLSSMSPAPPFVFRNYQLPLASEPLAQQIGAHAGSCKHPVWQAVRASSAASFYLEDFRYICHNVLVVTGVMLAAFAARLVCMLRILPPLFACLPACFCRGRTGGVRGADRQQSAPAMPCRFYTPPPPPTCRVNTLPRRRFNCRPTHTPTPSCSCGGDKFQDGAVTANNPSVIALQEARLLWPGHPLDVVVSLGVGQGPPARRERGLNTFMETGSILIESRWVLLAGCCWMPVLVGAGGCWRVLVGACAGGCWRLPVGAAGCLCGWALVGAAGCLCLCRRGCGMSLRDGQATEAHALPCIA